MAYKIMVIVAGIVCCSFYGHAQPGSPDITFGNAGVVITAINSNIAQGGQDVAILDDGEIITAGFAANSTTQSDVVFVKYHSDGSIDESFGNLGIAMFSLSNFTDLVTSMTIQPDGKIIASGFIELQSGIQDILLIRINPDGTPDTSFSEDGIVTTDLSGFADFGLHVMLQPDNKIIIAGYSGYAAVALRYHTDGVIDSSFGINGAFSFTINNSGAGAEILGGVIRSDGKIILTGTAYTPYNKFMLLIQLLPNGICDSTFDGDGILIPFDICGNAMEYANDVKIQADGKIVVAGSTFKYDDYGSGFSHLMLARFNSDGSWDSAFNAIGITGTGGGPDDKYTGSSLVIQPEGKLIVSGYISSFNDADPVMVLVRFNIDGIPDSSFGTNGQAKTIINHGEYAFAAVLQADGKIIESGYTCDYGDCKNVVCRFNNDVATVISNVSDPFAENFFFSPNPFTDFTTIHFFLYESEEFKIEVVDLYGRKIKTISAGKPVAGNHTLIFQKDNLAAGVYSVNLSTASGTISRKIIIL